jgi:YVTN family beta-propeller protein
MNSRTRRRGLTTARHFLLVALWVSLILVAPLVLPGQAYADGGAPNLAYVIGGGSSGNLVAIDIGQRRVTGRIHLGGDPEGVVLSVDGGVAYVAQAAANRIAVVDAHGWRVVATVAAGSGPDALVLDVSGSSPVLWVADGSGNTVTLVDPDAQRVLARILVGKHPTGLAIAGADSGISDPNDPEVYVANADSDSVSVLSVTRRQAVTTIPVPGGPVRVVVPATGGVAYVGTRAGAVWALSLADHRLLGTVLRLSGGAPGTMDYNAATGRRRSPSPSMGHTASWPSALRGAWRCSMSEAIGCWGPSTWGKHPRPS